MPTKPPRTKPEAAPSAIRAPNATEMMRTLDDLRKVQGSALIVGGLAVVHHGCNRTTKDVDMLYATEDGGILERLERHFRIVVKAAHGWHHLEHHETGIRLELVPEGGRTTHGFIPGPQAVGGENGFVSLGGLIWLKVASGRAQDDADVMALLKLHEAEAAALRAKLPAELQGRFDELLARAQQEQEREPRRVPAQHPLRAKKAKSRPPARRPVARRGKKAKKGTLRKR